jgi:hypothetical protein
MATRRLGTARYTLCKIKRAKMKLLFNKETFEGHWFSEGEEIPDNYTEKAPAHTNQVWSDELGDWTEKPVGQNEAGEG